MYALSPITKPSHALASGNIAHISSKTKRLPKRSSPTATFFWTRLNFANLLQSCSLEMRRKLETAAARLDDNCFSRRSNRHLFRRCVCEKLRVDGSETSTEPCNRRSSKKRSCLTPTRKKPSKVVIKRIKSRCPGGRARISGRTNKQTRKLHRRRRYCCCAAAATCHRLLFLPPSCLRSHRCVRLLLFVTGKLLESLRQKFSLCFADARVNVH